MPGLARWMRRFGIAVLVFWLVTLVVVVAFAGRLFPHRSPEQVRAAVVTFSYGMVALGGGLWVLGFLVERASGGRRDR